MNDFATEVSDILEKMVRGWIEGSLAILPKVFLALILALVGVLVARLVRRLATAVLTRVDTDGRAERAGLSRTLAKLGVTSPLSVLLPTTMYWLLLVLFVESGTQALGLTSIATAIAAFLAYVPHLAAAVTIFLVGALASEFAGKAVTAGARNAGMDFAPSLGRLVSAVLLFVCGTLAVKQLQVDVQIIYLFVACSLGGFSLAFGLSFGLGTRDVTRNIMAGFYARKMLRFGEPIRVGDIDGVLRAIGPTQAVIDSEGGRVVIANATLLERTVRQ